MTLCLNKLLRGVKGIASPAMSRAAPGHSESPKLNGMRGPVTGVRLRGH